MMFRRSATWFETASVSLSLVAGPAHAATIMVEIGNVRNARGHVHVAVCPEDQFLKDDCPYIGQAPAKVGITIVSVRNVPPGRYAAQAFQDENDNDRVDRVLFGIPKEGVGFSNDARIALGPPKWADAMFTVTGDTRIRLNMRYFLGPSGPATAH